MYAHAFFQDRTDAGIKLADQIKKEDLKNPLVLGLPRGGVVVADEVARHLNAPMSVIVARKIGSPGNPEFGIGAICEDEIPYFNPEVTYINMDSPGILHTIQNERNELERRISFYRSGAPLPDIHGRSVVVVDDGLATGVTAVAVGRFLKKLHPEELILAIPVAPGEVNQDIKDAYDRIVCLHSVYGLSSVGQWYEQFNQVEDKEVMQIMKRYQ